MDARRRIRSVRLSEEGLVALKLGLQARFESLDQRPGAKLTRETKAELLSVSDRTMDRIFRREPVDRSSLEVAFRSAGIPWKDSYCLSLNNLQAQPTPPTQEAANRPNPWSLALIAFAIISLVCIAFALRSSPTNVAADWQPTFQQEMNAATSDYNNARFESSWEHLKRAAPIANKHRDIGDIAWVQRVEGELLAAEGKDLEALPKFESAIRSLQAAQQWTFYYSALELRANCEFRLGRLAEAKQDYLEGLARAKETNIPGDIGAYCRGLGSVAHAQKDYAGALSWFQEALDKMAGTKEVDMIADVRARMALVYIDKKQVSLAKTILLDCLAHWRQRNHPRWIAETKLQLAQALVAEGDKPRAVELISEAKLGFERLGDGGGKQRCELILSR